MFGFLNTGEQVSLRPIVSGEDADTACRDGRLVMVYCNGKYYRCRSNGRLRTWKRTPNRFALPVKVGWRTHIYVCANDIGMGTFMVRED